MDKPLWSLRVQASSARSGSGPGRCFPVFPKVDAASPRGLMAPPGLSALGAKGSACDRLRLTGGLSAFALGSYIVSLRWRGTAPFWGRHFLCRLWRLKPYNRLMDKPLWGLRVLKFDGAVAPRVLKFDSGYAAEGVEGASKFIEGASLYKTIQPPCGRENAPLLVAGATTFPPAGGLYSSLCVERLKSALR